MSDATRLSPATARPPGPNSRINGLVLIAGALVALLTLLFAAGLIGLSGTHEAGFYWTGSLLSLLSLITIAVAGLAIRRARQNWRALADAESARAHTGDDALAKQRFLAVVSHDMRQPLHAITLYLSALNKRVDNPEAREILAKMERASGSMADMFASLLDLSRIQGDRVELALEDFALQDVIARVLEENPKAAQAAPTPARLHTDEVLFERLLRHLVANAIAHGGGAARIEVRQERGLAEISVVDDGPGIRPEDQHRVFDEFVRLEKGRHDGLGLGLAIVKRIVEVLDLQLELHSEPGKGARFTVRAPLASATI